MPDGVSCPQGVVFSVCGLFETIGTPPMAYGVLREELRSFEFVGVSFYEVEGISPFLANVCRPETAGCV